MYCLGKIIKAILIYFHREREQNARFAPANSFEYEFGLKWKEMYMMHNEAEDNLKRQFQANVVKLEIEQANAQMEYQTQKLREGGFNQTFRNCKSPCSLTLLH